MFVSRTLKKKKKRNLQVVHNRVTINHFHISAEKQNKKQYISTFRWMTVRPLKGLAISIKHTWKSKT